jgi:Flp pilus assembly protein TadG
VSGNRRTQSKGASILEFSLIGIGMIFVVLSFFEVARGMWTYQTLAYAVREGARYASVHGKDCAPPYTPSPGCQVTVSQIASVIKTAGPGVDANNTTVTLTPASGTATSDTLANLIANYGTTDWPPSGAYAPGQTVQVTATYPFRTFLAMFWMGGHPVADSQVFTLGASSTETIQF